MHCRSIQIGECFQVQSPLSKIEVTNQNRGGGSNLRSRREEWMGFFSFETAKHLYPPPLSCTVQTSRLWPWLPAWPWRIQSLQPFFDTDHSRKCAATRIGIQKKGGGWGSDYYRACLHAKKGDFKNNTNFCWNVPMESVGPGTITTSNGKGAKTANLSTQKRMDSVRFILLSSLRHLNWDSKLLTTLNMSTCVGHYIPNRTHVVEGFVSGLSKSVSPSKYV